MSDIAANCFRAQAPGQAPFGQAAGGLDVYAPFCPSVSQFSLMIPPFLDGKATLADVLPLSRGMSITKCEANNQLQLSLSDTFTRRMRRVYGYIGEMKLSCA